MEHQKILVHYLKHWLFMKNKEEVIMNSIILIIIFAVAISFVMNYFFDKDNTKGRLRETVIDSVLSIIVMLALYYGVIK